MTRLERKQEELKKLYEYKRAAIAHNDLYWLSRNKEKIDRLEKEIEEMRQYEPRTLREVLADRDECVKNNIYKSLLRISLLADATNEAAELCRETLKKAGLYDFTFREKVKEMCKLSLEIASIPLGARGGLMEDMLVNNDKFVDMCIKHADAHLKRTLKL